MNIVTASTLELDEMRKAVGYFDQAGLQTRTRQLAAQSFDKGAYMKSFSEGFDKEDEDKAYTSFALSFLFSGDVFNDYKAQAGDPNSDFTKALNLYFTLLSKKAASQIGEVRAKSPEALARRFSGFLDQTLKISPAAGYAWGMVTDDNALKNLIGRLFGEGLTFYVSGDKETAGYHFDLLKTFSDNIEGDYKDRLVRLTEGVRKFRKEHEAKLEESGRALKQAQVNLREGDARRDVTLIELADLRKELERHQESVLGELIVENAQLIALGKNTRCDEKAALDLAEEARQNEQTALIIAEEEQQKNAQYKTDIGRYQRRIRELETKNQSQEEIPLPGPSKPSRESGARAH